MSTISPLQTPTLLLTVTATGDSKLNLVMALEAIISQVTANVHSAKRIVPDVLSYDFSITSIPAPDVR